MHTLYFDIRVKKAVTKDQVKKRFQTLPGLAVTHKKSANSVFAFGRDHGYMGRILNQTVFVLPSLHVSQDGRMVTGFCFTPQDGNALISSVAAATWFVYPETYEPKLACLKDSIFPEV